MESDCANHTLELDSSLNHSFCNALVLSTNLCLRQMNECSPGALLVWTLQLIVYYPIILHCTILPGIPGISCLCILQCEFTDFTLGINDSFYLLLSKLYWRCTAKSCKLQCGGGMLCFLILCQPDTSYSPLGRGTLNCENAPTRLAY